MIVEVYRDNELLDKFDTNNPSEEYDLEKYLGCGIKKIEYVFKNSEYVPLSDALQHIENQTLDSFSVFLKKVIILD